MGKRSSGKSGTEVKISFGPSRPPASSSGGGKKRMNRSNNGQHGSHIPPSSAAAAASMAAMMSGANGNVSFGDIDLEALKKNAEKTFRNKNGLPCTEVEMKALMGMFVEIMGMSMNSNGKEGGSERNTGNTDANRDHNPGKNGNSKASQKDDGSPPVFSFGATPMDAYNLGVAVAAASGSSSSPTMEAYNLGVAFRESIIGSGTTPDNIAAATAGLFADGGFEALRRTYAAAEEMAAAEEENEDEEGFENRELTFEELEFLLHHRKQKEEAAKQFASGDWESLEQVAINDHLMSASDEKERKAAKKREKKQRRKAKLKEEAAQKAADAAQKKREKAIISWRSRVVSACQSNEVTKLDGLLQESPLRKLMEDERENQSDGEFLSTACIIPHLEFLLPNSVAKNRTQVERGAEARLRLADYIFRKELSLAFVPLRTGRTVLHTACFYGDSKFLRLLLDMTESFSPKEGENPLPESFLDLRCSESGWSPLHYAALSGSSEILEMLLAKGCDLSARTDVTHTWRESDGRGLSPRELVQSVQSGKFDDEIETHGLALQDMKNAFLNHLQDRRVFMQKLERVYARLSNIEKNGYSPLLNDKSDGVIDSEAQADGSLSNRPEASSSSRNKKKKKKKKKQNGKTESGIVSNAVTDQKSLATSESNSTEPKEEIDPLVSALLNMGFNEDQIAAAAKACGGTHRATADDLVTWILGQGDKQESQPEPQIAAEKNSTEKIKTEQIVTEKFTTEKLKKTQPSKDQNNWSRKGAALRSEEQNRRRQQLEAARQKEETARRLAAKREEARRRNREWNNREQARQEKEAKAKVAQKMYSVSRPSIPTSGQAKGAELSSKSDMPLRIPNGTTASHMAGKTIGGLKQPARHSQVGNKWGVPPVTKSQPVAVAASSAAPAQAPPSEQHILPMSSFFATTNDDDKTVSSFGSSRGMSVSSKDFVPLTSHPSVPLPGFTPVVTQPIAAPTRSSVATVHENPALSFSDKPGQGEIRATAKEFVPSFTIPGGGNSETLLKDPPSSNGRSALDPSPSFDIGLPSGILQGGSVGNHNSLLGSNLQNSFQNSFDKAPSINPPSAEPVVFGSSFMEGSKPDEPSMLLPFPSTQVDMESDIGGSRLLNSISRNKAVGGTSIWGGEKQAIPSLESTLHPSFFGDGTLNGVDNSNDDNKNTSASASAWHIPSGVNSGVPNGNGQGSIW